MFLQSLSVDRGVGWNKALLESQSRAQMPGIILMGFALAHASHALVSDNESDRERETKTFLEAMKMMESLPSCPERCHQKIK